MWQNYFIINGEKYYTGTIFIINDMGKQVEASFICYDLEHSKYIYKIEECMWHSPDKYFQKNFISVTNKRDNRVHMPVVKKRKDLDIDGLFIGWVWYVFLMALSIIFNGTIGFWILFSVIFFSWRSNKIKEEGTYIEW